MLFRARSSKRTHTYSPQYAIMLLFSNHPSHLLLSKYHLNSQLVTTIYHTINNLHHYVHKQDVYHTTRKYIGQIVDIFGSVTVFSVTVPLYRDDCARMPRSRSDGDTSVRYLIRWAAFRRLCPIFRWMA
jgi:hypothetical protein